MTDAAPSSNWLVPIAGLFGVTFTICTSELVISGLLPTLAGDLKVDIPTAGLLITGYAVGVAIAGPVLSLLTTRVPRKTLLLAILVVFIAGNILCAIAAGYWMLLGARLLMSACHGLYFGVAVVIASRLAPKGRETSAVSMIVAGVSIAIIVGVPLGTAIGNAFGWRVTFWFTAACGVVASLVVALLVPPMASGERPNASLRLALRAAVRPALLLCYADYALPLVAFFALLSYVVPFLTTESQMPLTIMPAILLATGIAAFLGSLAGGRLGDWNAAAVIIGSPAVNIGLFVLLWLLAGTGWVAVGLLCLIWLVAFAFPAPLQTRAISEAGDVPELVSTLMNTASQIGIAGGAAVGGLIIAQGWAYRYIPLFMVVFLVLSVAVGAALSARARRSSPVAA